MGKKLGLILSQITSRKLHIHVTYIGVDGVRHQVGLQKHITTRLGTRHLQTDRVRVAAYEHLSARTHLSILALILYRRRRFINHLLTYLLTYLLSYHPRYLHMATSET